MRCVAKPCLLFLGRIDSAAHSILTAKKEKLEPYTDYLISNNNYAIATDLSAMLDGEESHDQVARFLSKRDYTSKDLWRQVKSTVRQIERETGCLIFDDMILWYECFWPVW